MSGVNYEVKFIKVGLLGHSISVANWNDNTCHIVVDLWQWAIVRHNRFSYAIDPTAILALAMLPIDPRNYKPYTDFIANFLVD